MATNVYVDGFNLYNGCIKGTPYKWLDLRAFAQALLGRSHTVGSVHYFTAPVFNSPTNPKQRERQEAFIGALKVHSGVIVHKGRFQTNRKTVLLVARKPDGSEWREEAWVREEKGTDVNLATHLVWDSFDDANMTGALVISNDSDLQEAINLAQKRHKIVVTCNPHHGGLQPDHLSGNDRRIIDQRHLRKSQLPPVVKDAAGHQTHKPSRW